MRNSRRKKRRVGILIAAAVLLLFVVLILSVNIKQITITGNEKYTNEEIEALLFSDKWDKNAAYCYYKNRFLEHEQIPFVESYKIVFQGLNKVEVIVYEKRVVGYVTYMSSYMYFDKDGIIVESTGKKLDGIPLVAGLKFGHIALYQPLPVEDDNIFSEILSMTRALSSYKIQVDKIQFDNQRNAVLWMGDIEVVLGGSESINEKIRALSDMLPKLPAVPGTLYLDTYDEANDNMMSSFKKK